MSTTLKEAVGTGYKELILPQKLEMDESVSNDRYGRFIAEPFERGYAHTVGNSLRRILLSSLDGAAVSAVRIAGVRHEYGTIHGVREDVMNILLNLKQLRARLYAPGPEVVYLTAKKEGSLTAGQIEKNPSVEILNPDLAIAHLESGTKLEMEIELSRGRGYVVGEEQQVERPHGFLPLDALFTPVVKVHYDVENARVGQITDYDRLVMEIWTDGSSKILREALWVFIPEEEQRSEATQGQPLLPEVSGLELLEPAVAVSDARLRELFTQPVDIIELSVRAANCLKMARIKTIGDLVIKKDEELLAYKNFGKKSLDEIKERLKDLGLSLGMQVL